MRASLLLLAISVAACGPRQPNPPDTLAQATAAPARPRNVVLIIGDGMGPQQIGLLELYARRAPDSPYTGPTSFARMAAAGSLGLSLHDPMDALVVDSACSATQLALGVRAPSEAIGVDANGDPQPTVLERARDGGKATGLVSDTRITHATPAAFAAHVPHRSRENDIAEQLVASGADVLLSGGRRHFQPSSSPGSKRRDERDLMSEAVDLGYTVVTDRDGLADLPADGKVLGLFSQSGMMGAIAERATRDDADRTEPSLAEMAAVALERLDRHPDGFFVMIESGQIDWACHGNDAGWLLAEMQRADELLTTVLDWAEADGETLVVVTADHETGGFGLSYSRAEVPPPQDLPGSAFEGVPYARSFNFGPYERLDRLAQQGAAWQDVLRDFDRLPAEQRTPEALMERVNAVSAFPIGVDAARRVLATAPDPYDDGADAPLIHDFAAFHYGGSGSRTSLLAREVAASQGIVWATGTHTHTPVPVFAVGPGAEAFAGLHHHTELGALLQGLVAE